MIWKWKRNDKVCLVIVVLVVIGIGVVLGLAGSGQLRIPSQSQNQGLLLIPIQFQLSGQGYIIVEVKQGQGTVCAQDLTRGDQQPTCTNSAENFPVSSGDQVTFSATPSSGYAFFQFQAGGGAPDTKLNPVTAQIVQQQGGGFGFIDAYFQSVVTVTNAQTGTSLSTVIQTVVTTPQGVNPYTVTVTQTGTQQGGNGPAFSWPPTWVIYLILALFILVVVVLVLSRR